MIDDNKEDEYQFTELDGDHSFDEDMSMDEVKTSFPNENNLRKIILSGFAVVIVGFILFKFVTSYLSNKGDIGNTDLTKESSKKPVVTAQNKPTKPAFKPQPVKQVAPKVGPKPFVYQPPKPQPQYNPTSQAVKVVTKTVNDPKVNDKLDSLRRSSQKSSRKILRINNNVSAIRDSIDALSSKIGSLNVTISNLTEKVKSQQVELEALKPKPKKTVEKSKQQKNKITYHVKALIPGRGWLMSSQGVTVTVIEGTYLPEFGRVKSIDARHGKVIMSSGAVIRFSVSDT